MDSVRREAPELISVIIANHNYAAFVGEAIESALALDWPAVEVIVVDDGSTDDSRSVIARYADRVTIIHQANAGQTAACNAGFAHSRGDAVVFLDSDDLLHRSLPRELAAVWRPGISKVQFQMKVVDAAGRPTGALLPQYHVVPSPEQVRRWAMTAGAYPTPPGSGNVYARAFLSKIFPLLGGDRAADSYCLAAAPFLGDVVTVAKPLVAYRVHGRNQGAMGALDRRRFSLELTRAYARLRYAQSIASGAGLTMPHTAFERSLSLLPYRLASLRLSPDAHPIPKDSSWKVLRALTVACFVPQGVALRARAALWVWAVSVAVSPPKLGDRFALWRFASASRPQALKRALRILRVVKRYDAAA